MAEIRPDRVNRESLVHRTPATTPTFSAAKSISSSEQFVTGIAMFFLCVFLSLAA
jgi:hypothetical protein